MEDETFHSSDEEQMTAQTGKDTPNTWSKPATAKDQGRGFVLVENTRRSEGTCVHVPNRWSGAAVTTAITSSSLSRAFSGKTTESLRT